MASETLEELRERLLCQQGVQQMIQARAYEIYRMRGGQPGGEAQDWFRAEGEVLAFLIANESTQENEQPFEEPSVASVTPASIETPTIGKARNRSAVKSSNSKQAGGKKTGPKMATPRKSPQSKSPSKRGSKQPKTEETAQ